LTIWFIPLPFGIFYGHLVYFVVFLVYFSHFGILYEEKSGNPGENQPTSGINYNNVGRFQLLKIVHKNTSLISITYIRWSSHPPEDQTMQVRIPTRYKEGRIITAMLLI
jgi:hypothetical protein